MVQKNAVAAVAVPGNARVDDRRVGDIVHQVAQNLVLRAAAIQRPDAEVDALRRPK